MTAWTNRNGRQRGVPTTLRRKVMARDQNTCHVCHRTGANEVDHIIPVAEGGTDALDNLAPIHANPCHAYKSAMERKRGQQRAAATRTRQRPTEPHPGQVQTPSRGGA